MTSSVARPRPRVPALGRGAAAVAVAMATVHLALVDVSSLASLAMLLMAVACLPCAWHLWRAPTASVWGVTALVDAGMLAVHAQSSAAPGHAHHAAGASGNALGWLAVGLAGTQLVLAGTQALRSAVVRPATVPVPPALGAGEARDAHPDAGPRAVAVRRWPTSPAPPASTSWSRATPGCRTWRGR